MVVRSGCFFRTFAREVEVLGTVNSILVLQLNGRVVKNNGGACSRTWF